MNSLQVLISEYEKQTGKTFDGKISFVDSGGSFFACCVMGEIKIDKQMWKKAKQSQRKALVFHELTHYFITNSK